MVCWPKRVYSAACSADVALREFGDVGAGDEDRRLARGDDDALDVAIAFELVDDARRTPSSRVEREFVDLLAGKIEPDDGEIAVALDAKRGGGPRGCFSHGGIVMPVFASRSSASSSMYSWSMMSLYFLSIIFRFTFSDGVISSSSMVKSRGSSAKRRIFSCRSRFVLKRSISFWKICRTLSLPISSSRVVELHAHGRGVALELVEIRNDAARRGTCAGRR